VCVDLRSTFAHQPPDRASRLDPHPGPAANQLIAVQLVEAYRDLWSVQSR
jgi:hypothetical protein